VHRPGPVVLWRLHRLVEEVSPCRAFFTATITGEPRFGFGADLAGASPATSFIEGLLQLGVLEFSNDCCRFCQLLIDFVQACLCCCKRCLYYRLIREHICMQLQIARMQLQTRRLFPCYTPSLEHVVEHQVCPCETYLLLF